MVIFNSYVTWPEGIWYVLHCVPGMWKWIAWCLCQWLLLHVKWSRPWEKHELMSRRRLLKRSVIQMMSFALVLVPLNTRQFCWFVIIQMSEWLTFIDWGIKSWCTLMPLTVTKVCVSSLQRRACTIETDSVRGHEELYRLSFGGVNALIYFEYFTLL